MVSTGDEVSTTSSDDGDSSGTSSASAGAEIDDVELQEAQYDPPGRIQEDESVSGSDEDEDSQDSDRENRFQGPASTWRFFTEEERSLAHSLDQQRANDLSIHLYNVRALKAIMRDPEATAKVKPHQSKKHWVKPDEDGTSPWCPKASWTAWPLRPDDVPRSGEKFGVPVLGDGLDDETYKKAEAWKPSGDLEDEILAVVLRNAKEKHRAILMHDNSTQANAIGRVEQPSENEIDASLGDASDVDVEMLDESDTSGNTAVSESNVRGAPTSPRDDSILVDEDGARTLLQPAVRNVLSKLDGLLMGLHKSRQGQRRSNSRSRSRTRQSRSTSKAANSSSRSKSRRRILSEPSSDEQSEAHEADSEAVSEEENGKPKRRRPLNPRDWSEVLGMAAFTGWDSEVVDRAVRRCTSLFGEGMNFKTVPLNSIEITTSETRAYGTGSLPDTTADNDDFIVDEEPTKALYFCPISTCNRHEEPYDKGFRWREHLKRSHKYSNARIAKLEADLSDSRKHATTSATAGQGEGSKGAVGGASEQSAGAANVDSLLQPVAVKMRRGKDTRPRIRKTRSQMEVDEEVDAEGWH